MSLIGLINDADGTDKTLEDALGLFSIATSAGPATFEPTIYRGAIAVVPDALPLNPTTGTLAVDISAGNMLKWWDGIMWRSCSSQIISGGGGSGIGAGQTIQLQQGLNSNITIATSGPLSHIVANSPLPNGLFMNESNGHISGAPTVFGSYLISMTATFTDSTVATDTVGFTIAEAFPVTFTFDETPITNIPEGVYVSNFELTYTPHPSALPINWDITGLPSGMWFYTQNGGKDCFIYGSPDNAGSYEVTVSATNWAGTTTKTFNITVFMYNIEVFGNSPFNGLYIPIGTGFYYYDYTSNTIQYNNGIPSSWSYPLRIYQHESVSSYKLFFFETYASWIIADEYYFTSNPPLYISPMGSNYESTTLPSKTSWFGPDYLYIDWVNP